MSLKIDKCYSESVKVLEKNFFKEGIFASPGYHAIWSRDSMISFLGGSLVNSGEFKEHFKKSLINLAENQSISGQIPNAVDKYSKRKPHVDFKTIDSSLWFIIGEQLYKERYKSSKLYNKHKKNIKNAFVWLSYQDMGNDLMLEQLPTTDWQDAFPHRYGHTINTQALYYYVLKLLNKQTLKNSFKNQVNKNKDVCLWDLKKGYYLAWRWKNHNKYQEKGEWFDSLGNLMAIIFGLAEEKQSIKILDYINKKKINFPYPVKTIYPPIQKNTKDWQDYYLDSEATPDNYLNGGIWPYIGGFYVLALIKCKKFKQAEKELEKLAESNLIGNFPEWIHPKTKKPSGFEVSNKNSGDFQAWNAGMYILAYESLKQKKVLLP